MSEWFSPEITAICNEMRSHNNYDQLPVLADALVRAGCTDEGLLSKLHEKLPLRIAEYHVCLIMGGKYAESARWLNDFIRHADCPGYVDTVSAAIGINIRAEDRSTIDDDDGYYWAGFRDWGDGEKYLYFGGRDAHGEIPPEFWDHVAVVTGREIPESNRAVGFSCSC